MQKQGNPTRAASYLISGNRREAKRRWGISIHLGLNEALDRYSREFGFSVSAGDLLLLNGNWFVTHSGLVRLATRSRCSAIQVEPVAEFCKPDVARFVFRAIVYKTHACRGFTGYGDADPSNVSPLLHGAELRVAETRAVNRALRKAYGIPICSVEEIGSPTSAINTAQKKSPTKDIACHSAKKNGCKSHGTNGNCSRVRDRLCQLIRQHGLDAELVKAYAIDFCGTKTLREASRVQVENFVAHLADWAEKDRNALLCELNSRAPQKEPAL
jgi:hypothetical protein